ncbi:hypothetical protein [Chitinophaga ginsengisoli]|uniref:Lipoprotein n=1 Tax=Chitinophaga ginsengisoli TaxID=363837 RepID=A0A2P8FLG3_9BACT|nr:hypothetical protein [Chitinophaga ginsengisoli]PSL22561.1 hypothetical protein CLV42_12131 [Chitinophaga ginsengisoli]
MKRFLLFVLVISLIGLSACRTRKTGCPTPRKNWGAEKLLDEMSAPKRKKNR